MTHSPDRFFSRGFFTRFLELFTRNWGLKVLALILALVIYHALKPMGATHPTSHDRTTFQH